MAGEALISFEEAEQLGVTQNKSARNNSRVILIALVGLLTIIVFTLLVMTLLSLRGAKTGLSTIFPFLDNEPPRTLQIN